MGQHKRAFVAFDSAKAKHAVAIAEDGRDGEVRYVGEIDNSPDAVRKLVTKLSRQYGPLHFCYEAGPTGYGLHRQLTDLGHVCDVVAPTMIPKRCGDRVKTNRRDSVTLVKLLRAGELRAIWVPDTVHEAVRDLTRAREAAMIDLKIKRQQLLSFCFVTAGTSPAEKIGQKCMRAGSRNKYSVIRRGRSYFKIRLRRSMLHKFVC
jgi:transposase